MKPRWAIDLYDEDSVKDGLGRMEVYLATEVELVLAARDERIAELEAENAALLERQAQVSYRPDKQWREVRVTLTDEEILLGRIEPKTILLLKLHDALRGEGE